MTIYMKGNGYAKGSEFGNPTIIGSGPDQIDQAMVNIKRLLTWGKENPDAVHTLHISYDADQLNPRPEFYVKNNQGASPQLPQPIEEVEE
tara:strand:+ start:306 stop:575 length:270 start_codon:yes stop_codon:yes gene_type:complete